MFNKVMRVLIGIIIACAVLFGVYMILPGEYKNPITETVQGITKTWSKDVINDIKNAKVPNNDITFGAMLDKFASPAWTIADDVTDDHGNGSMTVYGDVYRLTVAMKNQQADNNITFTNVHVRLTFDVQRSNGKLTRLNLRTVTVGETEYGQESPYWQLALDSMAKQ